MSCEDFSALPASLGPEVSALQMQLCSAVTREGHHIHTLLWKPPLQNALEQQKQF